MTSHEDLIAAAYRNWAVAAARGRSQLYEDIGELVAGDPELLRFLAALPGRKWQPNLFLAAVQYLVGVPSSPDHFRQVVLDRPAPIAAVMRDRTTQTNQPARCATLMPALAQIEGPIALLEVGASAGLCLLPDRYEYLYTDEADGGHTTTSVARVAGPWPSPPRFSCTVNATTPRPTAPLNVVWRAGLDLNPLDVADADTCAWLEALVWPSDHSLHANLRLAIDVARADPPPVRAGDLRVDVEALAAQAPADATLVLFHTAVLGYLPGDADRDDFAATVERLARQRRLVWLANETAAHIPGLPAEVVAAHPLDRFLLCRDGQPLALTDPHGAHIVWRADE